MSINRFEQLQANFEISLVGYSWFLIEWFIDTVSMKVIKVTLVIHKVNMFSEKYPVEI